MATHDKVIRIGKKILFPFREKHQFVYHVGHTECDLF